LFGLFGSPHYTLVEAMVALSSTSIIHLAVSSFDSNLKTASDLEEFTSTTSDFIEQHSTVLC
jgi:hypothetical protein